MSIIDRARKLRSIIEKTMANIDDKTASEAVEFLPALKYDNSLIAAGTRINWGGQLKRASTNLWDTSENNPDNAPTLWEDVLYKDGIRIIPTIITSGTAFALDELGWWNNTLYRSLMNANVYTPDQYTAGWTIVE
jgi:hypothetical protein